MSYFLQIFATALFAHVQYGKQLYSMAYFALLSSHKLSFVKNAFFIIYFSVRIPRINLLGTVIIITFENLQFVTEKWSDSDEFTAKKQF